MRNSERARFPNAKWLDKPQALSQVGKFAGSGGFLVGVLPNGDQIQEHDGVLLRCPMSKETANDKEFFADLKRLRKARMSKPKSHPQHRDITDRITGEAS